MRREEIVVEYEKKQKGDDEMMMMKKKKKETLHNNNTHHHHHQYIIIIITITTTTNQYLYNGDRCGLMSKRHDIAWKPKRQVACGVHRQLLYHCQYEEEIVVVFFTKYLGVAGCNCFGHSKHSEQGKRASSILRRRQKPSPRWSLWWRRKHSGPSCRIFWL